MLSRKKLKEQIHVPYDFYKAKMIYNKTGIKKHKPIQKPKNSK